jgi:hypothetical protein
MKLEIACCVIAFALSGCVSKSPSAVGGLPLEVGNGIGSQYGNYEMRPNGETRDAAGDRCVIFNWDRPLNKDFAIRYSTQSCESKEHPIWMNATPYVRVVIPLSQSNLKGEQSETPP